MVPGLRAEHAGSRDEPGTVPLATPGSRWLGRAGQEVFDSSDREGMNGELGTRGARVGVPVRCVYAFGAHGLSGSDWEPARL